MPAHATPQPSLWHRAPLLLLLLPALTDALACTNLRTQQSTFNTDSLQLLRTMAPNRTVLCQQHHAPFAFPDSLRAANHPQQATATIRHILQQLFNILSTESIPDHWDRQAHQQLLNKLHHQIHQLQECFPESTMLSKRQGPRNSRLAINAYFRRIHDFLRTHGHSSCAWDTARLELYTCFQHIDKLTQTIQSQEPLFLQTPTHPNSNLCTTQRPTSHTHHLQQALPLTGTAQPSTAHGSNPPQQQA